MNSFTGHPWKVVALGLILLITSCEEQRRVIVPFVPSGNRVVLLEEFTGKGCTNCPKGSREIENLLVQFPDNLVAVSIHAGFFADPVQFTLGEYDFRTDEGEFLYDYLGPPDGYPSGSVNRAPVGGSLQLGLNQWASAITSEIQEEPKVDLALNKTYNPGTRELIVDVSGIGKENINGEIRISVMLTESEIVDAQDDQEAGGIVEDYVHKHVLRDMLTPAAGSPVLNSIIIGQTFVGTYSTTLPAEWVADNMEVIAFVSVVNGSDYPVLQAATAHVAE